MEDIQFVRTPKKCKTCGGRFKIEKTSDGKVRTTILFCENFCFEKRETQVLNQNRPWGEYSMIDGKSYLATNRNPTPRECYVAHVKGDIQVKFK